MTMPSELPADALYGGERLLAHDEALATLCAREGALPLEVAAQVVLLGLVLGGELLVAVGALDGPHAPIGRAHV